ncbi:MAG: alanine racemase [Candidatus Magasanikbacteria bacterium CG_4_9_14_3_um_filter_32_9]|uniref:Alanine racemase n=1 Tax=Candidatus Magasanikbacteria bacterium CG_4_9_14_3_um_filter_32_9 TaxID=1974644 RepID=A0A2M7Z6H3_9BACT|nr:MAG: alanine racemase [Candidatus Magasanikbacteria bacterium CG_4_9_14_3_um_filter_32_9]
MIETLRKLKRPKYKTFNKIQIIRKNILSNLEYLQGLQKNAEIIPVLKSNAYGHGLKEMCQILNKTRVKMVAVDSFPEAQIVYKFSTKKVLIIGEMPKDVYKYCDFKRTEFCIYNLETFKHLSKFNKKIKIHLFVNSGMNREGIQDLELFLKNIEQDLKKMEITGICSHFASADEESKLNKEQEEKFLKDLEILKSKNINPKYVHLGNSAGIFILKNEIFSAFRVGISLYGYNIFPKNHPSFIKSKKLKPALQLSSKITSIQKIKAGEKVSYNEKFKTEKNTTIATIPFGYYEGLDRRLSNKAEFLVKSAHKDFYAKIAGRVCMNLVSIDCSNNKIKIGDEVEIISPNKNTENSVQNLAKKIGTIPYEVLVKLQGNIRREII